MAKPMSPAQAIKQLRKYGLEVITYPGWEFHNRNAKGPWGPVHGVMLHHTVTRGTANTVSICKRGYASLPGPLCHFVIAKDGKVYAIGWGRANHAGLGSRRVLEAVKTENYVDYPPAKSDRDLIDFNPHFYGFECENLGDGIDPWPPIQLASMYRASAAFCEFHGWTEKSVIGHKEAQPGKIDPRGPGISSLAVMRSRVASRIDHPAPNPSPPPTNPVAYHTVKRGETLYGIAQGAKITIEALVILNPGILQPGDRLRIR